MKRQRPIVIKILALVFAFGLTTSVLAQEGRVQGRVVDDGNQPLVGAMIVDDATSQGTVSGVDGSFSLETRPGATLSVSLLGYQSMQVQATNGMVVVMEQDVNLLDDVVVVGYGTVRRGDLTTSVASVATGDLDQRPITTTSSAIQGKAAGVMVTQPGGAPGGGMIVRIRGASSLASSNDPLYVVDGVPVGEGEYAISYLSPNDIASMDILKDASAAAIYGSRAANGVVLITTKSGSSRDLRISFNAYAGMSMVQRTFDVLNVAQYKELMDETGIIALPDGLKDETDWFDDTYRLGVNQNYQLSASGGNDQINYYISGGYTGDDGIVRTSYYDRYNFKANLSAQVRKWIKVSTNLAYSNYKSNNIATGSGSNRESVTQAVVNTPTYAQRWNPDNPKQYWSQFYGISALATPAEYIGRRSENFETTDRLIASASADINILKGLTFKSTVSIDSRWRRIFSFLDPIATSHGRTLKGNANDERAADRRMIYDNILNYDLETGKHRIGIMAGTSATTSLWENLKGSRSHFSDLYDNAIVGLNGGNNGGLRGQEAGKSEWAIMSYLARATYNYDSKYLLTVNFRADGSSKLAPDYRWGYFPSMSAAWRIMNEEFMENVHWLSDLKLRVGWGQIGNQSGLSDYAYLQRYNISYYDWTNPDYATATPTLGSRANMKNEKLTWETTTTTNIGLDFGILNNRVNFTLDAYWKKTTDMLMKITISPYPELVRNEGAMSNKGFEFSVSSRNLVREFKWNTDFNMSFNRNELTGLKLPNKVYYYANTSELIGENAIRMTVGEPLSKFWGYIDEGVDPETGLMIYRDLNDDGNINRSDKTYIGDANPNFTFGMTNTFAWKGLNLSILMLSKAKVTVCSDIHT